MRDEFALHRIAVHVVELLLDLFPAPDVEIVEAALPQSGRKLCEKKRKGKLGPRCFSLSAERLRSILLQYLHNAGRSAGLGLADEQVHVLGHDHVADEKKFVARAQSVENFDEVLARADGSEERATPITTERDEVKIASFVVAPVRIAHASRARGKVNPRTLKTEGSPRLPQVQLGVVPEWYTVAMLIRQEENRACHPPSIKVTQLFQVSDSSTSDATPSSDVCGRPEKAVQIITQRRSRIADSRKRRSG